MNKCSICGEQGNGYHQHQKIWEEERNKARYYKKIEQIEAEYRYKQLNLMRGVDCE